MKTHVSTPSAPPQSALLPGGILDNISGAGDYGPVQAALDDSRKKLLAAAYPHHDELGAYREARPAQGASLVRRAEASVLPALHTGLGVVGDQVRAQGLSPAHVAEIYVWLHAIVPMHKAWAIGQSHHLEPSLAGVAAIAVGACTLVGLRKVVHVVHKVPPAYAPYVVVALTGTFYGLTHPYVPTWLMVSLLMVGAATAAGVRFPERAQPLIGGAPSGAAEPS